MSNTVSGRRFGSHKVTTVTSQPKPTPVTTSTKTVITVQTTTPKTIVPQRTVGARNTPIITRTAQQTQSKPIVTAKPTTSQMGISSNPVQQKIQSNINQPPNPINSIMKFGSDVGRGSVDTVKGYTTDIVDTAGSLISGKEMPQRSYRDEALTTVFTRGALEGNLSGAYSELGRRFLEEPGRVVGEVGTEIGINVGTMGVGAAVKGVKLGATGLKTIGFSGQIAKSGIKNSDKIISPSSTSTIFGFTKKTGLNPFSKKKGTEFIAGGKGSGVAKGYTLTTRTNKKGISSTKITKNVSLTGFTKGITSKSTNLGRRFNKINNFVTPSIPAGAGSSDLISGWLNTLKIPAVHGASDKPLKINDKDLKEFSKGYKKIMGIDFDVDRIFTPLDKSKSTNKEINTVEENILGQAIQLKQYEAGKHIIPPSDVITTRKTGGFGRLPTASKITGMNFDPRKNNWNELPTQTVWNPDDPFLSGTSFTTSKIGYKYEVKLSKAQREMVDKLIKESTNKIKNNKTLKQSRERTRVVQSKFDSNNTGYSMIDKGEFTGSIDKTINLMGKSTSPDSIPIDTKVVERKVKEQIYLSAKEGKTKKQIQEDVDKIITWYSKAHSDNEIKIAKEYNVLGTEAGDIGTPWTRVNVETTKWNKLTGSYDTVSPYTDGMNSGPYLFRQNDFSSANDAGRKMGGFNDININKEGLNVGSPSNLYTSASDWTRRHEYFGIADVNERKNIEQYNAIKNAKPGSLGAKTSQKSLERLPSTIDQYMWNNKLTKTQVKDLLFSKGYGGKIEDAKDEIKLKNIIPTDDLVRSVRARKQEEFTRGDMTGMPDKKWVEEKKSNTAKELGLQVKPYRLDEAKTLTDQTDITSVLYSIQFDTAKKYTGKTWLDIQGTKKNPFYPWDVAMTKTIDSLRKKKKTGRSGGAGSTKGGSGKKNKPTILTNYDFLKAKVKGKPTTPKKQRSPEMKSGDQNYGFPSWWYNANKLY